MPYIELDVLNNRPQTVIGIDLGTTNSLAAIWRDGRPEVLVPPSAAKHHSPIVPSVVHFPEDGQPIVGREARDQAIVDPRHTVFSVKRFMGRRLADVQADLERVPWRSAVGESERGVLQIEMRGKRWTPQEISALILMRVRQYACEALSGEAAGDELESAVITVPAYFDDAQRQATRDAARLAGLEVLRIVNEPTAASLAYGLDQREAGRVAVFDLGGGTFDVSILSIEGGVFQVLSTAGDTHLGGDDLDQALADLAREELEPAIGAEALTDPGFLQAIRAAAERCKIALSHDPIAELHLVVPDLDLNWRRAVTREEFEARATPFVARTLQACRQALSDAGLGADEIDEVVLVGGSTRVPLVRREVERFFGRKAHAELNPEEVVALGAAVQAHVLSGGTRDLLLMDVTPLSLGLETVGGAVARVITRNSPIPCQATEGFTTYADNQTGMDFHVVQGERELAADCRSLGRFKLSGIPPMPAGMARIAVRFHIDANGVLTVSAREESSGKAAALEVQPMQGLADADVERMLAESFANARSDFDARRVADLRTEIGTMVRASERALPGVRAELDRETAAEIDEALAEARAASDAGGLARLQAARDGLERSTLPLAALLMDSVAKAALTGKRLDEV